MEATSGPMPVTVVYSLIKAENGLAIGWYADFEPSIGSIVEFTTVFHDEHQTVEPEGWLICDGRAYTRKQYPELAKICRPYTSFWRWHLGREFNVPSLRFYVATDPGSSVYCGG